MPEFTLPHYMFEEPEDPDADWEDVKVPGKWEICERCRGDGHHDNPAFSNGITSSEWNGPDWDEDSRETYLSGGYDVRCEDCRGTGKVVVMDTDRVDPELIARYEKYLQDVWESEADERAERRYFASFER